MDWTASVDIYCERTGPELWSEPVNAVTNLAFFLAAWIGYAAAKRSERLDLPMRVLVGLTVAVGVGSTLFHTFAQRWSGAADVIPILLFIVTYLGLAVWRYFGARRAEAIVIAVAFLFFSAGLRNAAAAAFPPALQPATGYLPALVAIVVCGALLALRRRMVGAWLLVTGLVFTASLTFRSLDGRFCAEFPLGTHFLWHILNGAMLALLLVAWARHGARETPRRAVAPAPAAA